MFKLPFVNLKGRPPTRADAMSVDVELGDMQNASDGHTEHPLNNPEAAAGPLSTTLRPHVQLHAGPSGDHQHQSQQRTRGGSDGSQMALTRFEAAPLNYLHETEKQQIEAAIRKEISDKHQREIDNMKMDFESQMAELRLEMTKFRGMTTASVTELHTRLQTAQNTATEAQAENLAMAAELYKLRANQSGEGGTSEDTGSGRHVERPMEVDTDRTALSTLQLPQDPEARHEQALSKYGTTANDNEGIDYAEEENNDGGIEGGDEEEYADDESEDQGGGEADDDDEDVDMREVRDRLQPPSVQANNPTGRRSMKYVEVSDDDGDATHGSDVSMDEDASTSSPRGQGPEAGGIRTKGKAVQIPLNSQVPRPQQFSRPLGGAGPMATIRAGPSNTAATSPPSRASGPSKGGRRNAKDLRRKVEQAREWYREKGASQNSSVGSAEDRASGRADRPSRRLRVFSVIKLRGTNVNRTQLLKNVELLMNNLMDMVTYSDIIDVTLADDTDAREFKKGYGNPPALEPLRPYFGRGFKKHPWNRHLEGLFIRHYEVEMDVALDEQGEDTIGDMFMERLDRLRRKYRELTKDMSDGEREALEEEGKAKGRRNTRRINLFDVRRGICFESMEKQDGTVDQGWKLLKEMVLQLGSYGMSSDESEVDEKGNNRYNIRKRLWRSREVSDRLEFIDRARNTTNGKGKRLAGNTARERIRSSKNSASTRDPAVECPRNFYDGGFQRNLDNLHHRALNMKPFMELGEILY